MPHPHDIVIGGYVEIGKNVSIYNGVTLGAKIENEYDYIKSESERFPIINEGVVIYTGAKVVGHVEIGSNSIIGANSVVTKSFSSYSIIAGVPARMVGCVKKYFE
jgi:serine O-acetyltransferase